ncbi:MAG: DUF2934 domain-containing protein [Alphaproteobacteria bacterium]|nr:DUF2934 domain-containing protein [Alphaproteobacteria bacterium]
MTHFDEKTIRETAYYIWKNNGCQAGTSQRDWEEAVNLLERKDALTTAGHISSLYKAAYLSTRLKAEAKKKNSLDLMRKIILK